MILFLCRGYQLNIFFFHKSFQEYLINNKDPTPYFKNRYIIPRIIYKIHTSHKVRDLLFLRFIKLDRENTGNFLQFKNCIFLWLLRDDPAQPLISRAPENRNAVFIHKSLKNHRWLSFLK